MSRNKADFDPALLQRATEALEHLAFGAIRADRAPADTSPKHAYIWQPAVGDQVVVHSGVHGKVKGLDEETIKLEIADGVVIVQQRAMIMSITQKAPEKKSSGEKSSSEEACCQKSAR